MANVSYGTDVSYFQAKISNAYKRAFVIFRACDGSFVDPNAVANNTWCKANVGKRRGLAVLRVFGVYGVYEPGVDTAGVMQRTLGAAHAKQFAMLDVESWGGKITGDHSTEIQAQVDSLTKWVGNNPARVVVYGNLSDLASIAPKLHPDVSFIVAGYSATRPVHTRMIGWQYSDGTTRWQHPAGAPISSAPFGNCDHDMLLAKPTMLPALFGMVTPKSPTKTPAKAAPSKPKVKPGTPPKAVSALQKGVSNLETAAKNHKANGPVKRAITSALALLKGKK